MKLSCIFTVAFKNIPIAKLSSVLLTEESF